MGKKSSSINCRKNWINSIFSIIFIFWNFDSNCVKVLFKNNSLNHSLFKKTISLNKISNFCTYLLFKMS
ncbi:hypothetical protein BpHYR1_032191 [Brachionus plicatilis]|uniref:Uncharacterized protein n=1 Tax=Brachionus plicatilis TaxID=10195 RepID=A0A3M7R7M0_BRAPC|nr:hypothetical protein BpHYR1_032191 [Brachionus plicatilis]